MSSSQDVGNAAAIHNALEAVREVAAEMSGYNSGNEYEKICIGGWATRLADIADAALAKPPRNCDVGTADEQHYRHGLWCIEHDVNGDMAADCANNACSQCILKWCQLPAFSHYEQSEEKGVGNGSK